MRRRSHGVLGLAIGAAVAGVLLGVGVVSAQDMKGDAQSVRDMNAGLLGSAPKTDPTTATVPGYAGQAPDQQAYYGNPTAMQDDGLVVAGTTGKDNYDLANQGTAAPGAMGITGSEDWLKPSLDAHTDPMSLASGGGGGSVTGGESTECQTKTKTDTTVDKEIYTCETSTTIDDQTKSCTATYQPQIVAYTATCTETFNYATGGWDRSAECATAPADPTCTAGARTCVQASTPQTHNYSCQEGYTSSTTSNTSSYDCQEGFTSSSWNAVCGRQGSATGVQGPSYPVCADGPAGSPSGECAAWWANGTLYSGCYSVGISGVTNNGDGADSPYIDSDGNPYWMNMFYCPGRDTGGEDWSSTGCSGSVTSECHVSGSTCTDSGWKTIAGVNVYRDCWHYDDNYSCSTNSAAVSCSPPPGAVLVSSSCAATDATGACTLYNRHYSVTTTTTVNTPAAGCNPPPGSTLVASSCGATDASGTCTLTNKTYQWQDDPAGGCAKWATDYSCKRQSGGSWVDDATCDPAHDKACKADAPTCLDGPGTRVVNGVSVYSDCWQRSTSYECEYRITSDDCNPAANCKKVADNCLDEPAPADPSQCLTVDHEYDCSTTTTTTSTFNQCGPKLCLQDTCYTMDHPENTEFQQTFSQLSAIDQAAHDHALNPDLTVFKGEALKCRKAVLGFLNCCRDSGWGPSLGLASCTANEKKLMDMQDKKATHYVGTYCSKKALFGFCLEKSMSYCSYGGSLARIIQEAGHQQLPKGWGSAKSPDCSGFTIDEFTKLDLSNVDFSDFYKDKLKDFAPPDPGSTASNIQTSLDSLYATGKPSSGGPQ